MPPVNLLSLVSFGCRTSCIYSSSVLKMRPIGGIPGASSLKSFHYSVPLHKKPNILTDELPTRIKPSDVKVLLLLEDGKALGIFPKVGGITHSVR